MAMIANVVTDSKTGEPLSGNGSKLSKSNYQPPKEVKDLFARIQVDYGTAWNLQYRPFDEFDGLCLLDRARLDQQTWGAYVGATQDAVTKQWRWKGRKNTARNKIIGTLAHVIAGMLYPFVSAYNDQNEEDKMTARVMRILVENHLTKARYDMKFLFMMLSALVNPAAHIEVEYVEAMQRIKVKNADGTYRIEEAVDELLSGINLNIIPIDQILVGDFFTPTIQQQPFMMRVRRISYDQARSEFAGKYFINGEDQFNFVEAGKTRWLMAGQDNTTLYDIEWTEADRNYVQVLEPFYRGEDLQTAWVGGVFMGNHEDIYNSNPFKHRRMSLIGDKWMTIPIYPFAKTGFEPIDPSGRFYYYKSAAFKEFWDDAGQNKMHQLAFDGTQLDVFKPMFLSGVASVGEDVMVPGATVGMPNNASAMPYQLGPNLAAALNMMRVEQEDMSESTQDKLMSGIAEQGVTATATVKAEQQAQVIMQVFAVMIANIVTDVGELVMDDIVLHTTVGEVDATVPESLKMKFRTVTHRGKRDGKEVTSRIEFDTGMMGMDQAGANKLEWQMFEDAGGMESKMDTFKVNPYKFARSQFSLYIDPDFVISKAMGTDQLRKQRAFQIMMSPEVMPFIDPEAVVDKFVLEEYSDGDPDQFKRKEQPGNDMLAQIMGQPQGQSLQDKTLPSAQPQGALAVR